MNEKYRILVLSECDAFGINIIDKETGETVKRVYINQEDSIEDLTDVFYFLGYDYDYEEVY